MSRAYSPAGGTYIHTDRHAGTPICPPLFYFFCSPTVNKGLFLSDEMAGQCLGDTSRQTSETKRGVSLGLGVSLRPSIGGQHRGGTWEKQGRYQMGEYHHHRHTYIYLHVWCRVLGLSDELRACAGFGAGVLIGPRGSRHRQRCAGRLRPCQTPPAEHHARARKAGGGC